MSHTATGPPVLIWPWLILAAVVTGVPALAISGAIALRARAARTSAGPVAGTGQAAAPAGRQARWCGVAGLAAGTLLGLLLVADGRAELAPLACAGGYLAGLLAGEFAAQPPAPRGHFRAASLRARRALDYAPRSAVAAATVATALVAGAPAAFAFAPAVRYGSWQPAPGVGVRLPGGTTAWPGLTATAATALAAVAVLLLGLAGLRRVAGRPPLSGTAEPGELSHDELGRQQAGRAIAGAVLGFEVMALGATLISGSAGLAVPVPAIAPAAYLGSRLMLAGGLCCAICAVLSWLLVGGRLTRRRDVAGQSLADPTRPPGT